MLNKLVFVFLLNLIFFFSSPIESKKLDFKVITSVRHGIDLALDYIDQNVYRSNVDCLLGVAFVRAFMKTAYQNGFNIMDNSSLRLLAKAESVIEKSRYIFENDVTNGNNWKFKYLVDEDIWSKNIRYQNNKLLPFLKTLPPIQEDTSSQMETLQSSDVCLREIINSTETAREYSTPCIVSTDCWNGYFRSGKGNGYILTHKLLLLQVAKTRNCLMDRRFYGIQVRDICSMAMSEIISINSFRRLGDVFDLFLEQVLLCGYEGFTEFLQNHWLYFILKSQRPSGCFPDILSDNLKSRIKKDMTYFEDGCNDHTTGLGAAVLSLYYHYIVNEISI